MLDDFSLSSPRNFIGGTDFELIRGDVRDRRTVESAVEGVDSVIHLAGITGAAGSHEMRERTFDVNRNGTETVIAAAEDAGVGRLVLASSCNVYGGTYRTDLDEDATPRPQNPYAESKLAAERACEASSIETVALRLATNYGWSPGIRFNLVVNSFVFRALVGEPLTVYGDGSNWRPFVHVQDSARAFAEALNWDSGLYNVGAENCQIEEIAEMVVSIADRPDVEADYLRERDPGPSYHADFDKVRAQGFRPEFSLADGIRDLAVRFMERDQPAEGMPKHTQIR